MEMREIRFEEPQEEEEEEATAAADKKVRTALLAMMALGVRGVTVWACGMRNGCANG
jgi:hypothetical protein